MSFAEVLRAVAEGIAISMLFLSVPVIALLLTFLLAAKARARRERHFLAVRELERRLEGQP